MVKKNYSQLSQNLKIRKINTEIGILFTVNYLPHYLMGFKFFHLEIIQKFSFWKNHERPL